MGPVSDEQAVVDKLSSDGKERKTSVSPEEFPRQPRPLLLGKVVGKNLRKAPVLSSQMSSSGGSFPAALISQNAVYRFKLSYHNYVSSDAVGVLRLAITSDPGTTSFPEYASLGGLFTEVRVARLRLRVVALDPDDDAYATGYARFGIPIAFDDTNTGSLPGSIVTVMDHADYKVFNLASKSVLDYDVKSGSRQWALTTTPSPGPYAGCTGGFVAYQSGLTASHNYFEYYFDVEFEFRNRS
jgi:hypothetical protein